MNRYELWPWSPRLIGCGWLRRSACSATPLPPALPSRVNSRQWQRSELVILVVRIGHRREAYR